MKNDMCCKGLKHFSKISFLHFCEQKDMGTILTGHHKLATSFYIFSHLLSMFWLKADIYQLMRIRAGGITDAKSKRHSFRFGKSAF